MVATPNGLAVSTRTVSRCCARQLVPVTQDWGECRHGSPGTSGRTPVVRFAPRPRSRKRVPTARTRRRAALLCPEEFPLTRPARRLLVDPTLPDHHPVVPLRSLGRDQPVEHIVEHLRGGPLHRIAVAATSRADRHERVTGPRARVPHLGAE